MAQLTETARQRGQEAAQAAKDAAGDLGREAKQRGESIFDRRRDMAAEEVGHFAKAVDRAAETLRDEGDERVAEKAQFAARKLDDAADYLRSCTLQDVIDGVGGVTRRHPELVLGGLFVAGVAAMRLLNSSARSRQEDNHGRGYEGEFGRRYGSGPEAIGYPPYRAEGGEAGSGMFADEYDRELTEPGYGPAAASEAELASPSFRTGSTPRVGEGSLGEPGVQEPPALSSERGAGASPGQTDIERNEPRTGQAVTSEHGATHESAAKPVGTEERKEL